jgi:hypothetical protein
MTAYLQGSTSNSINRKDTNSRTGESNNSIHSLEEQRSARRNTYLCEDLRRKVLDALTPVI